MEFTKLSNRLDLVASFVPAGARLLDVGSDHAYLPIALLQEGKIEAAIAGEVVEGPYQSALQNVADNGLEDKIEVRLANGLAAFEPSDAISCVTIAGMGGRLIADIAIWSWYGRLAQDKVWDRAGIFLDVKEYKHLQAWTEKIANRPAVQRGLEVEYKEIDA